MNENEVDKIKAVVQHHYEQRKDNRCHLDDDKLYYDVLGIGTDPYITALPETCDMLTSCIRYIRQRQNPLAAGSVRLPFDMTIDQLTKEVERLQKNEQEMIDRMQKWMDEFVTPRYTNKVAHAVQLVLNDLGKIKS